MTSTTGPGVLETAAPASGYSEAGEIISAPERALAGGELTPGTTVGDYVIEGKLGEGGMGRVYGAVHPVIGKKAAVKVLRAELCASSKAVARFVKEARAVNQIGHPSIVDIFAFGELDDGRSYLVMERLEGESLAAWLRRERPRLDEACRILGEIVAALQAAHEQRIIHRDLKPDNVHLVPTRGGPPRIKLLDFGIAKLLDDRPQIELTQAGSVMGTPQYIAPEQARGDAVDEAVDVYSLGVMAFEMLTGRPPFVADNALDMVSQHLHATPPSPATVVPGLPPALVALVVAMLAKAPGARPSLADVRAVLEASRLTAAPGTTGGAPGRATRRWLGLAGVILVGGGLVVGARLTTGGDDTPAAAPPRAAVADGGGHDVVAGVPSDDDFDKLDRRIDRFAAGGVLSSAELAALLDDTAAMLPPAEAANLREAKAQLATLSTGGVPASLEAPPPPGSARPGRFDVEANLVAATAVARTMYADAALVRIDAAGVRPDGKADLARAPHLRVDYRFVSPSRAGRADDPAWSCMVVIGFTAGGVTVHQMKGWACDDEPTPPPRCTAAQVWRKAIDQGAPTADALGTLGYRATPAGDVVWYVDVGSGFSETIKDDC